MKSRLTEKSNERDREIRQHILDAARELFLAQGYNGVSMKDIAEVVHVTSAALYYHFPEGKSQLFTEMLRTTLTQWSLQAQQAMASHTTLLERMQAIARVFSNLHHDSIAALMRDAFMQLPPNVLHGVLLEGHDDFQHHLLTMFQDAIDAGEIRDDISASELSRLFETMLFAPPPILMSDQRSLAVTTITTVLLEGLRPR